MSYTIGQVVGNAFEIFGIDFLLSEPATLSLHGTPNQKAKIQVHLLEINACPDFKQTGDRLQSVIQRLFEDVLKLAVKPFFDNSDGITKDGGEDESWRVGQTRDLWLKCADEQVDRPARPW